MCGEQNRQKGIMAMHEGSPPRVRGTVDPNPALLFTSRITPACAGNSRAGCYMYRRCEDHPRVCGEQKSMSLQTCILLGSPPRVRGTDKGYPCCRMRRRITPACAGNSGIISFICNFFKDHPRVCGEQPGGGAASPDRGGSPPRVRGTAAVLQDV